jgi:hypothetical protein
MAFQAIRTRYHGPTNTRGSRISAKCQGGTLSVPYDHALDDEGNHKAACMALVDKFGWARLARDGRYEAGVFDGDFYWVARS